MALLHNYTFVRRQAVCRVLPKRLSIRKRIPSELPSASISEQSRSWVKRSSAAGSSQTNTAASIVQPPRKT